MKIKGAEICGRLSKDLRNLDWSVYFHAGCIFW